MNPQGLVSLLVSIILIIVLVLLAFAIIDRIDIDAARVAVNSI